MLNIKYVYVMGFFLHFKKNYWDFVVLNVLFSMDCIFLMNFGKRITGNNFFKRKRIK